jgi:hypothetical protein
MFKNKDDAPCDGCEWLENHGKNTKKWLFLVPKIAK